MNRTLQPIDVDECVRALRFAGIDPVLRPHHAAQRLYELRLSFSRFTGRMQAELLERVQREYAAGAMPEEFARAA